jgi:hypothetical protein
MTQRKKFEEHLKQMPSWSNDHEANDEIAFDLWKAAIELVDADSAESSADNGSDWYDYEMNVAHQPAPVGTKVLVDCYHQGMKEGIVIGAFQRWNWVDITGFEIGTFDIILVKPIDHDRKAKAERKRVVDAALSAATEADALSKRQLLERVYDKGFLRLPGESK